MSSPGGVGWEGRGVRGVLTWGKTGIFPRGGRLGGKGGKGGTDLGKTGIFPGRGRGSASLGKSAAFPSLAAGM